MGVVLSGFKPLEVYLRNIAERSSRGAREELEQGALDIKKLARLYVPEDTTALKQSILLGSEIHGFTKKVNGRNVYTVEVDMNMPDGHNGHQVVGDYADMVHEHYQIMKAGKNTVDKRAANPGVYIGEKFLERAMEDLNDDIKRKVEARVDQGIGH